MQTMPLGTIRKRTMPGRGKAATGSVLKETDMATDSVKGHSYKDLTFQQLRSFCETVRLGGFAAAARALDLARPTVWQQVHALERRYGIKLVEPYARGCKLTEAGRI